MEFTAKDLLKLERILQEEHFNTFEEFLSYLEEIKDYTVLRCDKIKYLEVSPYGVYIETKKGYDDIKIRQKPSFNDTTGNIFIDIKYKPDPNFDEMILSPGTEAYYVGQCESIPFNEKVLVINRDDALKSYTILVRGSSFVAKPWELSPEKIFE